MSNHITPTQRLHTYKDWERISAEFLLGKLGRAANRLFEKKFSWSQIAEILEYDNGDAIRFIAERWGKDAK